MLVAIFKCFVGGLRPIRGQDVNVLHPFGHTGLAAGGLALGACKRNIGSTTSSINNNNQNN
ncbi:hypothetical protein DFA_11480 [Cavenderia fasciculata]|uniref:Uncharacterized protein n=1 Tax=Cavenderia fasciculata TaxID=261658 RepID=F4QD38_CACFS|nr:uncharacterized protein DFA_11480 [Cavenderia fasciculata]EGG13719.1 hypothetical protein DFA_11480 [Cavenderia fasciculata]|eukprot:XP_004350423.1 hypothetical protein DFA_11480 [Cavenderia fasciculata]